MVAINFSFRPEKKPEKYPNIPVLTYTGEEGLKKAKKFHLNKKALELLNYKEDQLIGRKISFARDGQTKTLLLINTTDQKAPKQVTADVTAQDYFSNVKFLEKVNDYYDLDLKNGDELSLSIPDDGILSIDGLMKINQPENETTIDVVEEVPDIPSVEKLDDPEPMEDNF